MTWCRSNLNKAVNQWQSLTLVGWWGFSWGRTTMAILRWLDSWLSELCLSTLRHHYNHRTAGTSAKGHWQIKKQAVYIYEWSQLHPDQLSKSSKESQERGEEPYVLGKPDLFFFTVIIYSICVSSVWVDGWEWMHSLMIFKCWQHA